MLIHINSDVPKVLVCLEFSVTIGVYVCM
jgi:hypothetical protein